MPTAGRNADGGPKLRRLAEMSTAGRNAGDGPKFIRLAEMPTVSQNTVGGSKCRRRVLTRPDGRVFTSVIDEFRMSAQRRCALRAAPTLGTGTECLMIHYWPDIGAPRSIFQMSDLRQPNNFPFELHFLYIGPTYPSAFLLILLSHSFISWITQRPIHAEHHYNSKNSISNFFQKISGFYNAYAKND